MAIVGSHVFAFYAVAAVVVMAMFGTGVWPLVIVGGIAFVGVQYKLGKWMALRSVGAEELPENEYRELHRRVESLSRDMGIDKPRLMIAEMGIPNAFAVGRKGAGTVVVAFVSGAVFGLFSIAHAVRWALERYYEATFAFLVALIVGALRAPVVRVGTRLSADAGTGWTPSTIALFITAALVGVFVVLLLERAAGIGDVDMRI